MTSVTRNMSKLRHVKKTRYTESAYVRSCSMKELTDIWQWISIFLKKRKQCVVVDDVSSSLVDVDSGVPQGTVLGPILFILHINDQPSIVSSKVRLFAEHDCLIYRQIKSI